MLSRFLGKRSSHSLEEKARLELDVQRAQEGDMDVRNNLIQQYTPFILKVTSKVCKRFIDSGCDEFSVALEAFDEAISKYAWGKGSGFVSFADLVIRRRVIDYIRKESKHIDQLSFEHKAADQEEESEQSPLEAKASIQLHQLDREATYRREEIQHYKERLNEYNIDLMELPDISPKHADARQSAQEVARIIVDNQRLRSLFLDKKKLPMKELMNEVEVSRKTVERNRNYIVAIIVLLMEEYEYLKSYVMIQGERRGV